MFSDGQLFLPCVQGRDWSPRVSLHLTAAHTAFSCYLTTDRVSLHDVGPPPWVASGLFVFDAKPVIRATVFSIDMGQLQSWEIPIWRAGAVLMLLEPSLPPVHFISITSPSL